MSGFDSARFADEPSNVGPVTMEELRTETVRIAGLFANAPRLEVFFQTDLHRRRIFGLLDGRQRLSESRDLYLLAGTTLGMLADVTVNLGYHDTAMSHARAALLCARESGHDGLVAFVRSQQAMIAYWAGRPTHAVEFARTGLESSTSGTVGVRLSTMEARAAGALGDARTVEAALERAGEARENVVPDDLDDLGGLLTYPVAKQHFHAGQAYLGLRQGPTTVTEAEACITAYQNGPHEERVVDAECMAQVHLATAHVIAGDLEAARDAAQPALAVAPEHHTAQIDAELRALHQELCASAVHDAPVAVDLRDQIEDFLTTAPPRPPWP